MNEMQQRFEVQQQPALPLLGMYLRSEDLLADHWAQLTSANTPIKGSVMIED